MYLSKDNIHLFKGNCDTILLILHFPVKNANAAENKEITKHF